MSINIGEHNIINDIEKISSERQGSGDARGEPKILSYLDNQTKRKQKRKIYWIQICCYSIAFLLHRQKPLFKISISSTLKIYYELRNIYANSLLHYLAFNIRPFTTLFFFFFFSDFFLFAFSFDINYFSMRMIFSCVMKNEIQNQLTSTFCGLVRSLPLVLSMENAFGLRLFYFKKKKNVFVVPIDLICKHDFSCQNNII